MNKLLTSTCHPLQESLLFNKVCPLTSIILYCFFFFFHLCDGLRKKEGLLVVYPWIVISSNQTKRVFHLIYPVKELNQFWRAKHIPACIEVCGDWCFHVVCWKRTIIWCHKSWDGCHFLNRIITKFHKITLCRQILLQNCTFYYQWWVY